MKHGSRITWPMVIGWVVALSLLWPTLGPYILGEKVFDTAGGTLILSALVGILTHSPLATPGGGIPRPPVGPTIVAMLCLGLLACGGASFATRTAYGVEATRCAANERAIVDRVGTTEAQDREALRAERERCDDALHAIEGAP